MGLRSHSQNMERQDSEQLFRTWELCPFHSSLLLTGLSYFILIRLTNWKGKVGPTGIIFVLIVVVINYNQFGGLRQHKCILYSSGGQKFKMSLSIMVLANLTSSGGSRRLFILLGHQWLLASLGLWPHHSSLGFCYHMAISSSVIKLSVCPSPKDI